ncbi:hypothetical protein O59_002478 [Cellvibrio sp. BR]|uniref:leucine-rich repeat domain-containing protein n=1 Tax=Cellvibrio sp. BR TaxID=1134474 RepID=UPI0002601219|nr:leucine-rich repeat domain-containing protein [Cellvibrio sp. BR]EIK44755.1 hypothetical protein O59_002478 [Cellvibrio sp. BR]
MSDRLSNNESCSIWDNPNLRGYLGEVSRRHGVVDSLALPNMRDLPPIQLEKLFVQPELSPIPFNSQVKDWPSGESLLECLTFNRAVILLGDPGSGKTTLINWLAWRLSSGLARELPKFLDGYLPIPCVLREIESGKFNTLRDINNLAVTVAGRLLGSVLTEDIEVAIKECISSGKYFLMLDGVDEIPVENREVVAQWILKAESCGAYVVATSRIVGYEEYPLHAASFENIVISKKTFQSKSKSELSNWLKEGDGYQEDVNYKNIEMMKSNSIESDIPHASQWAVLRYLMPFNDQRIENFIGNWYLQRSGSDVDARERSLDLLAALKQSKATYELARTPNLLSLISIVHRERAHLPDGRALLYKEISNAYVNTIDSQRNIKIDNELLRHDWVVREGWISYVGFKMQLERSLDLGQKKFGVLIEKEKILLWLGEVMAPFFHGDASNHAEVFLNWVARRSGLLLPKGEGLYAFVHLSFQEYFCARYISSQIVTPKFIMNEFSENDLVTGDSLLGWSRDSSWSESFIYFFELISSEVNPTWISFVVEKLFSPNVPDIGLYGASGRLAARILANPHVSLTENHRQALARKCSCNDTVDVESALAKAGFAISVNNATGLLGGEADSLDVIFDKCINSKNIYKIVVRNGKIKTHPKFKSFENIEALNLIDCRISGLSFLRHMKKLKQLRLDGAKAKKSYSHISALSDLNYLYLGRSDISDVSIVKNLKNLVSIDLDDTAVNDVSFLSYCHNLLMVSLQRTKVTDISFLRSISDIRYCYLDGLNVDDYSAISNLSKVNTLSLASSNFNNFDYICDVVDIVELNLSHLPNLDVSNIFKLKSLRKLIFHGASARQLQFLKGLAWLEELYIMDSDAIDLEFASDMRALKKLVLDGANTCDISPLRKLRNLEYLDIENTNVSDVSVLSKLKNLKTLMVRNTKVKSIGGLKSKLDLTVLGLPS